MYYKPSKPFIYVASLVLIAWVLFEAYYYYDSHKPVVILSQKPEIRLYRNFITAEEAQHLISIAEDRLKPSTVYSKGKRVYNERRNSSNLTFNKSEDEIIKKIEAKACSIVGCDPQYMEALQLVHYTKGQKNLLHYDYFTADEIPYQVGQRVHTFLIYLNDISAQDGGLTIFPLVNIAITPKIGTALYFKNSDGHGNVDPLTLHEGAEILNDGVEKWACNIWIRDKPQVVDQKVEH